MSTESIVALLISERDKLNRAIEALDGTKAHSAARQETQVAASAAVAPAPAIAPAKKKRVWTAANRKAHTERMKSYWAAKRKAAKK